MKKKILSLLVLLMVAVMGAWAQEVTKIAVGGSTQNNNYVPLPGNLAQNYTKCEFVYPATMLTALNGYDIKRMTFGASAGNQNWGDARFQVFLKEVDFTTISAYSGTDNATTVYEGELYLFGTHEMEITFTIPYTYHGGNLLIGVYQTVKGKQGGLPQWLGENATGASVRGSNSGSLDAVTTATQCNFLPKVTFTCVSSAPAGPEVTWDAATKSGTFTTPDYDVELEVTYFNATAPTANATAGDIHAGTATPLINAASTTEEGATMKYLVTATNEQPTSTDDFSADVPTAEAITGPGTYYVWYYLDFESGDDSDISPTAIQVTVADYLNYTVSLAEGTADADKWAIAPADATDPEKGVKPGTEITLTYSGTKRVKSVKAVKEPEPKPAAEATAEDKGKMIGADGKIYADVAAATAAGTTAVAKIIYIGTTGHATYSHGLALALTDEASKMAWEAAIDACSAKNTSTPVTGATWLLASKDQWDYMMGANGAGSHYDLRDGFSSVGGSNLQWNYYWSSTEDDSDSNKAWYYYFASGVWLSVLKGSNNYVRACLAF